MLDIPSISAIIAAVGVLVGVTLAYLEVRALVKARRTDVVMGLFSTFGSKEFQEAYEKVSVMKVKNYNDVVEKGFRAELFTVGSFFEGTGVLVKRGLVDFGLVNDLFRESIKSVWEKTKSIAEDYRRQFNQPLWGVSFEYLYNEQQKTEQSLQQTQQ